MKIAVLGAGGKLGSVLVREYAALGEVTAFSRRALDITSLQALEGHLNGFDVVLNCAAEANVDRCEQHPAQARAVNGTAVAQLANLCTRRGIRLIHFSTDYVFDGRGNRPYRETDPTAPLGVYGQTKREGEQAVLASAPDHLVVRVSWVFGPFGVAPGSRGYPGFVDQVLNRALKGEPLEGICDKWSIPTFARDIARELWPFLQEQRIGGVLHLTQSGPPCTWQEYAQAVVECGLAAGLPLRSREVQPRRMAEVPAFVGPRPVYTPLATERLKALTGRSPRSWKEALEEYVRHDFQPAP